MQESEKIVKMWRSFRNSENIDNPTNFKVVDQIATAFTAGKFFYYIFDFSAYQTDFVHENMRNMVATDYTEFSPEAFLKAVHPEEVALVLKKEECAVKFLFEFLPPEEMTNYKITYTVSIRKPGGTYYHNLHQALALNKTEQGSLGKVICTETDITHLAKKPDNTISFIHVNGGKSYYNLDVNNFNISNLDQKKSSLTDKELDVLKWISYGDSNHEIADKLDITYHTVITHRKNILRKENSNSMLKVVAEYLRKGFL